VEGKARCEGDTDSNATDEVGLPMLVDDIGWIGQEVEVAAGGLAFGDY
jgi:hypothetical protein